MRKTKSSFDLKDLKEFFGLNRKSSLLIVFFAPLLVLYLSVFQVNEVQTVFVIEFGKIVRNVNSAGLHFKVPFVQDVVRLDKRILQIDLPEKEVIASDQKRLIIDAYAKYRITDARRFYETFHHENGAVIKITSILDSALRQVVAKRPLSSLLSSDRNKIMQEIQEIVSGYVKDLGVEIIDVRIIKTELPMENSSAVFNRIRTDREKEAKEMRAEGEERATIMRAEADKEAEIIKSDAYRKANKIKGEADAKVIQIYADSFSKDPEFFVFYRSMDAYKNSLQNQNFVINSKENQFFDKFYK